LRIIHGSDRMTFPPISTLASPSFSPFLVIIGCLCLGFAFRRSGRFPEGSAKILNAYVIGVALPAVVLSQLPRFLANLSTNGQSMGGALFFLPLIPWLLFFGAMVFFWGLHRMGWIRRDQWGLLVLAGGLGNTSFVGIPLIEALLGPEHIPLALLLDQFGTFLALSVGGTLWISFFHASGGGRSERFTVQRFAKDLFRFPPFFALLLSFPIVFLPLLFGKGSGELPAILQVSLERIAATLVPVAMVSVGVQLRPNFEMLRHETRGLLWGLGYKMALAPLVILFIGHWVLGLDGDAMRVGVIEAAMAPMITATVLGIEAGMAPNLGALLLGIGIPLSLLTVPLWNLLLSAWL
jgi:predicted permease